MSAPGSFPWSCRGGCVPERRENVVSLQVGVAREDIVHAAICRKLSKYGANRHAGIADAGQASHPIRVGGDSGERHAPKARATLCSRNLSAVVEPCRSGRAPWLPPSPRS